MVKLSANFGIVKGEIGNIKSLHTTNSPPLRATYLRAILCKNQTKWEMKNFDPPTQICMEVGPHEGCSKMSIIRVIT